MKLVNMKLSKEKKKEMVEPTMMDGPEYPRGLQIRLETEAIEKLGMDKLPDVETVVDVVAKAKVVEVRTSDAEKGKKNRNIELQITDLSIEPTKPDKDYAKELYGQK